MTSLGLVQMTRKKMGTGPGRGVLRAVPALPRAAASCCTTCRWRTGPPAEDEDRQAASAGPWPPQGTAPEPEPVVKRVPPPYGHRTRAAPKPPTRGNGEPSARGRSRGADQGAPSAPRRTMPRHTPDRRARRRCRAGRASSRSTPATAHRPTQRVRREAPMRMPWSRRSGRAQARSKRARRGPRSEQSARSTDPPPRRRAAGRRPPNARRQRGRRRASPSRPAAPRRPPTADGSRRYADTAWPARPTAPRTTARVPYADGAAATGAPPRSLRSGRRSSGRGRCGVGRCGRRPSTRSHRRAPATPLITVTAADTVDRLDGGRCRRRRPRSVTAEVDSSQAVRPRDRRHRRADAAGVETAGPQPRDDREASRRRSAAAPPVHRGPTVPARVGVQPAPAIRHPPPRSRMSSTVPTTAAEHERSGARRPSNGSAGDGSTASGQAPTAAGPSATARPTARPTVGGPAKS